MPQLIEKALTPLIMLLCLVLGGSFLTASEMEGRWLFQIALDSGQMLPAFILEVPAEGVSQARLLSDQARGEMQLSSVNLAGSQVEVNLTSRGAQLTFAGKLAGDEIRGTANGAGLSDRAFIAKRTDLQQLGRSQPPGQEERVSYTRALSQRDPQARVKGLREFIRRYSRSDLAERAYEKIFDALLEMEVSEFEAMQAAQDFVVHSENRLSALDRAAAILAEHEVYLQRAETFSEEVLAKADPKTPSMPRFLQTRAKIALLKDEPEEALRYLRLARELAPSGGEIPLQMANAYHKIGNIDKAQELYLEAYLNSGSSVARARVERFYRQTHGSSEGLDELIHQAFSKRPLPFEAGRYQGSQPQTVILMELFTGSECVPCQAADYAFNGLVEHYPHQVVSAIQYHLHIPKIDPMANPDAYRRASYYDVQSTPAAIFGGTERQMGGGRKDRAQELFGRYQAEIRSMAIDGDAKWNIDLSGRLQGDVLHYRASAAPAREPASGDKAEGADVRLHLTLVEGSVEYIGYNGVYFHHNVVRKMLPDPEGAELQGQGQAGVEGTLDLMRLEAELEAYLQQTEKDEKQEFSRYMHQLNRDDLYLVAFVQERGTKRVLQAAMAAVESKAEATASSRPD
ncbi:MAG TPA: hypothetical protein VLV83_00475 [Acidobacteriota bacterium]|nr:hypothetical protein [Acidobacteriota bacterium]